MLWSNSLAALYINITLWLLGRGLLGGYWGYGGYGGYGVRVLGLLGLYVLSSPSTKLL